MQLKLLQEKLNSDHVMTLWTSLYVGPLTQSSDSHM